MFQSQKYSFFQKLIVLKSAFYTKDDYFCAFFNTPFN